MNTRHRPLTLLIIAACCLAAGAADGVKETLQKGLYEEEANRNLEAAAQAYRSVITSYDQNRQLTATAIFRLAECYRKLGKTNEANAQYERIVREFSDQTTLVDLSRKFTNPNPVVVPPPAEASPTNAEAEELRRVQALVKDSPDLINTFPKGSTMVPLMTAGKEGHLRVAAFLLDHGAQVNLQWADGNTALHYAVENGHKAMTELLLSRGAEINRRSNDRDGRGATPLHYAVRRGFKTIVEFLLTRGADINVRNKAGDTPLLTAVEADNAAMVDFLLAGKADPDISDNTGNLPLLFAATYGQIDVARVLIQRGANVNARLSRTNANDAGATPLMLALNLGRSEFPQFGPTPRPDYRPMLELLITNRANVNLGLSNGLTPLMRAVLANDTSILELLVNAGANLDAVDLEQRSAFFHATMGSFTNAMEFFFSRKVNPEAKGPCGLTAMHVAATRDYGDTAALSLLLKHKVNIDAQDDFGCTPLHYAAYASKKSATTLLIAHRADPGIRNQKGFTPYSMSSRENAGSEPTREVLNVLFPRPSGVLSGLSPQPQQPLNAPSVDPRQETTQMLLRYTREREALLMPRDPTKK